jgi:hypothetical protein
MVLTNYSDDELLEESLEEQPFNNSVEKANKHAIFFICKV